MFVQTWCLLFTLSLSEWVFGAPKGDPIVMPVGEVGGMKVLAGFENINEYKNTLIGAALLFICREVYQFLKDRANKTGEKIGHLEKGFESLSTELRAFMKAQERAEERLERRVSRLEEGNRR